jgi:hypothetical protein
MSIAMLMLADRMQLLEDCTPKMSAQPRHLGDSPRMQSIEVIRRTVITSVEVGFVAIAISPLQRQVASATG